MAYSWAETRMPDSAGRLCSTWQLQQITKYNRHNKNKVMLNFCYLHNRQMQHSNAILEYPLEGVWTIQQEIMWLYLCSLSVSDFMTTCIWGEFVANRRMNNIISCLYLDLSSLLRRTPGERQGGQIALGVSASPGSCSR